MMNAKPSEPRRLHGLSWVFITASSMKGFLVPAIVVLVFSAGSTMASYQLLGSMVIIPTLIGALLKQAIYNYRFDAEELVIRDGILTKKERHIPYARIHNIALVRNPVHRMFAVASARIETAAGGKPEAVMRVLSIAAVEELRAETMQGSRIAAVMDSDAEADETEPRTGARAGDAVLLQMAPGELVRLGLISNRGFLVVAAASGLLWQTIDWDADWGSYYARVIDLIPSWATWLIDPVSFRTPVLVGMAVVVLFFVLLRLFSVAWHVIRYHDFTLRREDEGLRTEYGLFTQVSSLIPAERIQLTTVRATLLHRLFARSSLDLEMAGAGEAGSDLEQQLAAGGARKARQWLAPLVEDDRTNALIREVLPEVDLDSIKWNPLSTRARRRIMKRSAVALVFLTVGVSATLALTPVPVSALHAIWLPLLGLPVTLLAATGWVRNAGYALNAHAIFFRSGLLTRYITIVRFDKMQTVALGESPFDRRRRMASVTVDTAGAATAGHRIDIPYLDRDVAEAIVERLYVEARGTEYRW